MSPFDLSFASLFFWSAPTTLKSAEAARPRREASRANRAAGGDARRQSARRTGGSPPPTLSTLRTADTLPPFCASRRRVARRPEADGRTRRAEGRRRRLFGGKKRSPDRPGKGGRGRHTFFYLDRGAFLNPNENISARSAAWVARVSSAARHEERGKERVGQSVVGQKGSPPALERSWRQKGVAFVRGASRGRRRKRRGTAWRVEGEPIKVRRGPSEPREGKKEGEEARTEVSLPSQTWISSVGMALRSRTARTATRRDATHRADGATHDDDRSFV